MMKLHIITLAIMSVVLAGCAVGPDYVKPVTLPITLTTPHTLPVDAQSVQLPWWTFFEDARLNQLVDAALVHNHDIRQAQANLATSRAMFDERREERYPTVTAQAGYQRGIQQQVDANGTMQRPASDNTTVHFAVQWEIDLFGRLQRLSQSAQARAGAADAELALVRLTIAANVARHYYTLMGLNSSLQVAQAQVSSWQETHALLASRTQLGSGLPEETENAHAQLERSHAAIPPLLVDIQAAQFRLDVLTGQRPGQGTVTTAALTSPLAKQLPIGDVDTLIRQRPDVIRAERLLAASTTDVGAATADLYPRLNLGGFIGFFALRGGDLGSSASRAFQIAPNATWPLLGMGTARARLRGAKAQSEGALARYEQVLLIAQEEVDNALHRLQRDQDRLGALLQSAQHSTAALAIATQRYRAGSGSYMMVLDNQRTLYQIRQEVAQAETASYINAITLYQALGWGTHNQTGA